MAIMTIASLFVFSSCKDDDAKAVIPHLASISVSPATSEPGARCTALIKFDRRGENIQGHYQYTITPGNTTGTFNLTPNDSYSFTFSAPSDPGTYTIKVTCTRVDTYVGSLYYMGSMSDIGTASTTFTVTGEE